MPQRNTNAQAELVYNGLISDSVIDIDRIARALTDAYNRGYRDGMDDGWSDGHEEGYSNGWDEGYSLGKEDAST